MPSRERRREMDLRSDRFESEIRSPELLNEKLWNTRKSIGYCNRCQKAFEETTKVCPRCDKKDQMGRIMAVHDRDIEAAKRRCLRDAKAML